jgi:choline dehydrogenase
MKSEPGESSTYDYVIVGGGSAGCVLAARLSEDPSVRVLLLEAGHRDWSPLFRIPIGTMRIGKQYDWAYDAEPDPTRMDRVATFAAGKVLGGGSSVNAMFWARGNPGDYDRWAVEGAEGWAWADVLPYFKKLESYDGGGDAYRGGRGPQHVSQVRVRHEMTEHFIEGAVEAGHKRLEDFNGSNQIGVSYSQYSQRRGLRDSTSSAYLRRARWRRNLTVRTLATCTRVLFDGKTATGVEYRKRGRTRRARAEREVILAAGALASPKLLMLSGIGPVEQLSAHGIQTLVDSPFVGKNLQEHPYAPMMYRVTKPTLNVDTTSPKAFVKHGLNFLLFRRGPITSGGTHAVVFARPDSVFNIPQTEILFAPFGIEGLTVTDEQGQTADVQHDVHNMQLAPEAAVTVYPSVLHPRSRGEVRLGSARPNDPPVIDFRLFDDPYDAEALTQSCRAVREIFATKALKSYVVAEQLPGDAVSTDQDFENFFKVASFGGFHPVSTCKMGNDTEAVVDTQLKVKGVNSLRVVDASVIPTLPSGHTNAAVIMIAEKAADMIRTTLA